MHDLTLDENAYDELAKIVGRAAKSVAYQWPGVVEADDVEQSIWLRLLESPGSVEKIVGMDDRARYRAIVGIGHQIASGERDDYDHFKGSYRYSVAEVKSVLSLGVLSERLNGYYEISFDLEVAIAELDVKTPQYADAIRSRYEDDLVPTEAKDKTSLSRALTRLTNGMNKSHRRRYAERDDGPGTRRCVSNTTAINSTEWEYSRSTLGNSGFGRT